MIILNYNDNFDFPIKDEYTIIFNDINNNKKKNKKRRNNKKKKLKILFLLVIFVFLLCVMGYSLFKVVMWNKDNIETNNNIKEIEYNYDIVSDSDDTEYINESEEEKTSDYWYYVKFPLISVNFDELIMKNDDTVAWINVNNTNINYPVVQYSDNDYYLNRSYDKSYNEAGWVFMDYRNNKDFSNKNTILYAHSRLNKTMFGSLSKTLKKEWYTNKDNHIIRISTPEENFLYQIFSVYVIPEENYYITTSFSSDDEYSSFLNKLKSRSRYDFNTKLGVDDKILTLSTCYSDTERTVVHAKLIKREVR